jgi:poly-gamma-glutamate system protein
MKKIYWRPQGMPLYAFILVALFSVAGLAAVEHFRIDARKPYYREKLAASKLALEAMEIVKQERMQRGLPIDQEVDPTASGLIGSFVTPVTSDAGDLDAKQTSINPNFAAVIVDLLKKAKVKEGDPVAVSLSGSFPALNICVYAALTTLHLKPTIISSVGASQWGANDPSFLWIDMENLLYKKGVFPFRSSAASMGGKYDKAREMTGKGRELIAEAIKRNDLTMIRVPTVRDNIDERMRIYFTETTPKVYINVGGGMISAGIKPFKRILKPGLLLAELPAEGKADSVINRFLKEEIPVIHIENVKLLAKQYGLPMSPTTLPQPGEGEIYYQQRYNPWLAGGVLLGILLGLYVFGRVDWGFRMLRASAKPEVGPPEPMV